MKSDISRPLRAIPMPLGPRKRRSAKGEIGPLGIPINEDALISVGEEQGAVIRYCEVPRIGRQNQSRQVLTIY